MSDYLDHLFETHAVIKQTLRKAILGELTLEPNSILSPDQCEVGKWIVGAGAIELGHTDELRDFAAVHAQFHQAAHGALTLFLAGKVAEAHESVERGEFQWASEAMIIAIQRLKKAEKA